MNTSQVEKSLKYLFNPNYNKEYKKKYDIGRQRPEKLIKIKCHCGNSITAGAYYKHLKSNIHYKNMVNMGYKGKKYLIKHV